MGYTADHPDVDVTPVIESVNRDDWNALSEPCPECGNTTIRERHLAGNIQTSREVADKYDKDRAASPIQDLDGLNQLLFAKCKSCGEVLYMHPAASLIDQIDY
ncbi:hypothetical protein [Salinibaculum rarum]|uniref:hypothetical protein n=1 Tax=Salinibaculum rarum TaxID=3058903 RepID=UPI00265F6D44|nr:hypothetical protein [Salinibaculum sp. KK48]